MLITSANELSDEQLLRTVLAVWKIYTARHDNMVNRYILSVIEGKLS